jgi:hypothetical protein
MGSIVDSVLCQCQDGYFGDGVSCKPCKVCDSNANMTRSCTNGSQRDITVCSCNVGFYGNGSVCSPCKSCSDNAAILGICPGGQAFSTAACACNAGYYGSGFVCSQCGAGFYSGVGKLQLYFYDSFGCFILVDLSE